MWIQICGASGSGKKLVAEMLINQGFENLTAEVSDHADIFLRELITAQNRLIAQAKAQDLLQRRDVVTVRSFWDSYEVMIPMSRGMQEITLEQAAVFDALYKPYLETRLLRPPSAVIYIKMPLRMMQDRMLLDGKEVHNERMFYEIQSYERYISKLAVPILEIDGSQQPDALKRQVDFSLNSLKAVSTQGSTVWQKEYFR